MVVKRLSLLSLQVPNGTDAYVRHGDLNPNRSDVGCKLLATTVVEEADLMVDGTMRWVVYGAVCVLVALLLLLVSRQNSVKRIIGGSTILLIGITPGVVGSLVNRWLGQGHEGRAFTDPLEQSDFFVFQVGIAVVISFTILKALGTMDVLAIATAINVSLLLFNSRIGDAIFTSTDSYVVFLPVLATASYSICKSLSISRDSSSATFGSWAMSFAISLCALLALRLDGLQTGGGWFHVSYFVGVIQGLKTGGILMWDTPSQYGFLSVLLPSLIPGLNAEYSFLLFQALLLFGVSVAVLATFNRLVSSRGGLFLGILWVVVFFFADPSLIGPQPFPSSSVMRFGPSLLLLLLLNVRNHKTLSLQQDAFVAIVITVAILWSFESAFYSLMIFGMWTFAQLTSSSRSNKRLLDQLRVQILTALSTTTLILVYSFYVYVRVRDVPSWQWFYLVASRYAAGFGGLPTDLWGAGWLMLIAILGCVLLINSASDSDRASCFASVGALLGWLTYYMGRSHSSNIIAMLPLILLAVLLPVLRIAMNNSGLRNNSIYGSGKPISVSLSVVVVLSSVVLAGVITSPLLPNIIANARFLPQKAVYESEASFPGSLEKLLVTSKLKKIPIAYQGHMGMLPRIPSALRSRVDSEGTWLPQPLGLLEEPIPESVRSQMLKRRFEREPVSGYFIWHKSMSEPGRADLWLSEIARTHSCEVIAENSDWQVSECLIRPG